MQAVLLVLVVSVYWLSWFVIGVGILAFVARRFRVRMDALPQSLWLLGALVSGCFVYLLFSVILYATHSAASIAAILYILLLAVSVAYLCTLLKKIHLWRIIPKSKMTWLLIGAVLLDFLAAIVIGSALQSGGDSYIHIGRIHDISVGGYNILTPYSQFAIDANYHYNLVYSLYQPLLALSNISALDAWRFSSGFFRAVNWLCVYAAALTILSILGLFRKSKPALPAIITIFAIIAFGHVFMYSAYPSQVAVIWLYTLVLSAVCMMQDKKIGCVGVILSSLLLTFTHPSYALMGAALVVASAACMLIMRVNPGRRRLLMLCAALLCLAVGPLAAYILSGPLTAAQADIAQSVYQAIGPIVLRRFDLLIPDSIVAVIFSVAAIVGTGVVLMASWKKSSLLFCAVAPVLLLWIIIMYVPGVLNLLMLKLPPWLIGRFDAANVFQYVIPFIALLWMFDLFKKRRIFLVGIFCIVCLSMASFFDNQGVYKDMKATNGHNYALAASLDTLLPDDKEARLDILAEPDVGYQTMAVRRVNLLDVGEGHTVPRANPVARQECGRIAMSQPGVSGELGANYVLWKIGTNAETTWAGVASNTRRAGDFVMGTTEHDHLSSNLALSCNMIRDTIFVK